MESLTLAKEKVADALDRLGFRAAATKVKELADRKRKLAVAYEHYRFVTQDKVTGFNKKLYEKTYRNGTYQQLVFDDIKSTEKIPPASVLTSLEAAIERKCFDSFEVAYIREIHDPILFGRIANCPDRFFIDQWDNDVKIEDILKANEG